MKLGCFLTLIYQNLYTITSLDNLTEVQNSYVNSNKILSSHNLDIIAHVSSGLRKKELPREKDNKIEEKEKKKK